MRTVRRNIRAAHASGVVAVLPAPGRPRAPPVDVLRPRLLGAGLQPVRPRTAAPTDRGAARLLRAARQSAVRTRARPWPLPQIVAVLPLTGSPCACRRA